MIKQSDWRWPKEVVPESSSAQNMPEYGFLWTIFSFKRTESKIIHRGGSRTAATSKVELLVIIVNGFQPLSIITKSSTFDVAAVLDPPLIQENMGHRKPVFWHILYSVVLLRTLEIDLESVSLISTAFVHV